MNSNEINELVSALVQAQGEFSAIPKTADNPFFKSKYAALPDVVLQATPILSKHGLAVMQFVDSDENGDYLTTYLTHSSGQFICHTARLHLVKNDPQAHGSAITYMRRYAFMSALGLVADEDDDGNYATQAVSSAKPASSSSLGNKMAAAASKNDGLATDNMVKMIWAICHKGLNWGDAEMFDKVDEIAGRKVGKLNDLTFSEAKAVIEHLKELQGN